MDLVTERLESLKAGVVGGLVAKVSLLLMSIVPVLLEKQFPFQEISDDPLGWQTVIRGAIGLFTGFLFGVTYRYIIRQDNNPQLKAGGVMAFGLIRGLAQVEVEFDPIKFEPAKLLNLAVLLGENVLLFALIALVLSWAIDRGWIRAFNTF